jgi:hypothetical protein
VVRELTDEVKAYWASCRKDIPFTDQQIAEGFREASKTTPNPLRQQWLIGIATRMEEGRPYFPMKAFFTCVAPLLAKQCEVCGKTALYRWGINGRCRVHKDVKPEWLVRRQNEIEDRTNAKRRSYKEFYTRTDQLRRHRAVDPRRVHTRKDRRS